jgi:hypothetical protein
VECSVLGGAAHYIKGGCAQLFIVIHSKKNTGLQIYKLCASGAHVLNVRCAPAARFYKFSPVVLFLI